ncbi:glycine betaine ABC transporter substrate-binding protein [Paraburkholderia sp. BL10I2N1]|uniref:glycine betaine ABC transporter substrate-binding protein n=1 Tax=Paraburkholderia sp. BL10I2N1 TaxID=1938796 RepID=UPI00105D3609|nr:glycine betaine ABC transporter substrate-binding protein [Paraburkholderia sp. BL10I2N1]TDN63512.1 glycine betaine/proline transport system substrate-binding protein [Paraburkholderia sp. BL10I2N1]
MIKLLKAAWLCSVVLYGAIAHAAAPDKTLTIGVNNWAENIAVANLWKVLLTQKGYSVKLQPGDKAIIYSGVAQGKLDLTFEVWLPSADGRPYDNVKAHVDKIGPWFDKAQLGLAVPDYVKIDSVDQLNAAKDEFSHDGQPTIFGIESGSGLMGLTSKAKQDYALDYNVLPSSEAAMLLTLQRAEQNGKPVVVTLWNPHWVWAKYKLHYLKDPKGTFGTPDSIYAISAKRFSSDFPDASRWMNHWKMNDQTLGDLMNEIRAAGEAQPEKGAENWVKKNQTLVDAWMK